MFAEIINLKSDLEHLKSAFGNALRVGAVEVVDPVKGYRLRIGKDRDGQPFLSPWLPHPESGKTSVPLKTGQIVGLVNPTGDMRQGLIFRGGYSGEHQSPNDDMAANVFEDAGVRITVADGALVITAGGVSVTVNASGLFVNGGRVDHDGRNIGSNHTHGGVFPGGAETGPPS
ncbi:baseplate assembly protein [Pararhizobium haloflavum]|uniref:baseplate assembly protein n=1 Tax=Pararhizobium haloflavum TaxID=2037914 RepID=UPI000C1817F5|nr:baseplate assembly protein [Pararhizobium haloflavum]